MALAIAWHARGRTVLTPTLPAILERESPWTRAGGG